jgi:hypothetical protein
MDSLIHFMYINTITVMSKSLYGMGLKLLYNRGKHIPTKILCISESKKAKCLSCTSEKENIGSVIFTTSLKSNQYIYLRCAEGFSKVLFPYFSKIISKHFFTIFL